MSASCQQATSRHSAGMSEVVNEVAMRISLMSNFSRRFLWVLFGLCCANVLAYFIVSFGIGGDALKGEVIDGHFYVGHQGTFVEVSEAAYTYARWHGISLFLTLPLIGLIGYRLKTAKRDDDLSKSSARSG
jgi:hypothetical protein